MAGRCLCRMIPPDRISPHLVGQRIPDVIRNPFPGIQAAAAPEGDGVADHRVT